MSLLVTRCMDLEHQPYPKIERSADDRFDRYRGEWVATEKIHGANLVVATDGVTIRVGKRKAWLADDEPFFGWQLLRGELFHGAATVHRRWGAAGVVWIYGELFGGQYPHPDVAALPGLTAVQTGVWYAPSLVFAAFDILVEPSEGESVFLSHDESTFLAREAGWWAASLLARGRYAEVSATPTRFPTRVPSRLGLPALPNNFAEGIVLKAAASMSPSQRPAVKRKIAEFEEARFDDSHAFDPHVLVTAAQLLDVAIDLMNGARIASARSKVGTAPELVLDEAVLDAWIDLEAALPTAVAALRPVDEAQIQRAMRERGITHL